MKAILFKGLPLLLLTSTLITLPKQLVKAQSIDTFLLTQRAIQTQENLFASNTVAGIIDAGTINAAADHFLEVSVTGEPLDRLKVVCVNFHELSGVKVIDAETGAVIPHKVNYGFEEFTITFDQPVAVGTKVRTIMEDSTVRGINTGFIVPYRVFSISSTLGEIPIGTAIVRTPETD